jgi:hypothetical protein
LNATELLDTWWKENVISGLAFPLLLARLCLG